MTSALAGLDFFRTDPEADPRDGLKEWQHFVLHGEDARIIINFSLSRAEYPTGRHVGRIIVLVHHAEWSGTVADIDIDDVDVERGRTTSAQFGDSRIAIEHGVYIVDLHLPQHRIEARLRFEPVSTPFVKNNEPLASGRVSWLFVPRLLADGHLSIGPARFSMHRAVAYHDHNWGRFRWGDDFGWQWGTALPMRVDDPWSIVFMRMTDRTHSIVRSQGLYIWHDGRPAVKFRDATIDTALNGLLRAAPQLTLPGVLGLAAPGSASDIPESIQLSARRGDDWVDLVIAPYEFARVAIPAEMGPSNIIELHEVSAHVRATGSVAGNELETEGSGVVEFLR